MAKTRKQRRATVSIELLADIPLEKLEGAYFLIDLIPVKDLLETLQEREPQYFNEIESQYDLLFVMERRGVPPEVLGPVRTWVESPNSALDWN